MTTKKHVRVVGAVIVRDGLVLCARRGPGTQSGRWEFPGGKVEPGESERAALVREIVEELRCGVHVEDEVTTTRFEDDDGIVTLTTYYCTVVSGDPVPTEHSELRWLRPAELPQLDWAPADVPAVLLVVKARG